ncbi:MAG: hypothetical protein HYT94_04965 [Parcubacteria group bacterium]|nr:hypothetical protein [Parcubacteria group bacterium]
MIRKQARLVVSINEFIYAPRLDNLVSCYAASKALIGAWNDPVLEGTYIVACFNHEEVGSESAEGVGSPCLEGVLERISESFTWRPRAEGAYRRMLANSFCISSDMAHALNPSYPEKHEPNHAPIMNKGIVLKTNVNQRYATNADTAGYFVELCQEAGVAYQHFVNRADLACGTTIGPMLSNRLGIPTVDVGGAMLSMHSIRECAGVRDMEDMVKVYSLFFAL